MGLHKGRKKVKFTNFLMLGRDMVLHCEEWSQLSSSAKVLYIHLKAKHDGTNNGKICLHYSELRKVKGFRSDETISKAFAELEERGWISKPSPGGLYRIPNRYGLTGRYDDHIVDRSHTMPEKYKESTHSVVHEPPPVSDGSFGLKISQPETPSSSQARIPNVVASGANSRS